MQPKDGINIVSLPNSFESLMEKDKVLDTDDTPPHVKTSCLNVAAKDSLEDVLDDDDEEVEEVYIEDNGRHAKQNKGASTPSDQRLCSKVFKQWQWTSNGLMCYKGSRIILGWNPDIVNVVVVSFYAQVMHVCVYFKDDKKELFCSFVYAHNRYLQRRDRWNNLATHKNYIRNRPWCILGDFNVSLSADEKSTGPSYIDTGMRDFQDCVKAIEVSDVNRTGLRFTWNQNPKGEHGTLKKIDRIMANLDFYSSFVGSSAVFQPYRISDHSPAVLRIPMESTSNPLLWMLKCEALKTLKNRFPLDLDPSNLELREEEAVYLQAFKDASLLEEKFIMQKAKVEWLKLGDANIAYFHKVVPLAFIDHYSEFFGQQGVTSHLNSTDLFCNKLTSDVANYMVRDVSDQEIRESMFVMRDNKAPGPDGYTAAFFKEAWEILATDVTKAIKEFFTNGRFSYELMEKVKGRISDWKNKSLSYAGRVQLIRSVLASMHIYWASVFILLTGLMLELEQLMKGFLWCQCEMKKGRAKVKDIIVNDSWICQCFEMSKYSDLGTIGVPHLSDASDKLVWKDLSNVDVGFSVATVWECIRPRSDEVDWYHVVWFSHQIPRHAIHLWLVIKRKLKTQDKLRQWDVSSNTNLNLFQCPLCGTQPDSHDHLFFECMFSLQVWDHLKWLTGIPNIPSGLDAIVDFLSPMAKMRSVRSVISKLVFAASCYFIWQERNSRLFMKRKRSQDQVIDVIKSTVRLKLLSCRFKRTKHVQMLSHLWELPTSSIHG
ncbi:RNA-directed DNA polymerase, eukaryota, reverse transcriptase zinc-binding domain protein [Tanacetum coccineum]